MGDSFKPRGNLVLVEAFPEGDVTTKGGVILSGKVANAGIVKATVLEVGPGRYLENGKLAEITDVKAGDVVLIQTIRMIPVSIDEQKVGLLHEQEILAVIER